MKKKTQLRRGEKKPKNRNAVKYISLLTNTLGFSSRLNVENLVLTRIGLQQLSLQVH